MGLDTYAVVVKKDKKGKIVDFSIRKAREIFEKDERVEKRSVLVCVFCGTFLKKNVCPKCGVEYES